MRWARMLTVFVSFGNAWPSVASSIRKLGRIYCIFALVRLFSRPCRICLRLVRSWLASYSHFLLCIVHLLYATILLSVSHSALCAKYMSAYANSCNIYFYVYPVRSNTGKWNLEICCKLVLQYLCLSCAITANGLFHSVPGSSILQNMLHRKLSKYLCVVVEWSPLGRCSLSLCLARFTGFVSVLHISRAKRHPDFWDDIGVTCSSTVTVSGAEYMSFEATEGFVIQIH